MCGRYVITSAPEAIRALFRYWEQPDFPPRYNVAPTQPVPIVRMASGVRSFALVRWGFVPAWVKDPRNFTLLVNARGESVGERAAFKNAMARRRCLFPADGFYEWKAGGEKSRPYFVRPRRGGGARLPLRDCGRHGWGRTARRSRPPALSPPRRTGRWRRSMTACRW
jgi:putative SOS response-associated peptidase YedK